MEVIPFLGLSALVKKLLDFVKLVLARDPGAITQAVAFIVGIAAVMLFAQSDWAEGINIADTTLADLNAWSQVIVGLGLAGAAGVATDTVKALDDSDSARMPSLFTARQRNYRDGAE